MKICPKCGAKNYDIYQVCPHCHSTLDVIDFHAEITAQKRQISKTRKNLRTTTKILMIIGTAISALTLIASALLWSLSLLVFDTIKLPIFIVPTKILTIIFLLIFSTDVVLTLTYSSKVDENESIGLLLKISILIVFGLAGIFALCDTKNSDVKIVTKIFLLVKTSLSAISMIVFGFLWYIAVSTQQITLVGFSILFAILSLVIFSLLLLVTSSYSKKIYLDAKISIGFKLGTLIFLGLVPGILMLCDADD